MGTRSSHFIKSRKVFKAMYHDLVFLEKVENTKTVVLQLSLPIKVSTFYEAFVMF